MVRQAAKGKVLGKEKKLALVAAAKKRVTAKAAREDKHWKKALAKMSADKKEKFAALTKVAHKGITRRALRKDTGRKADTVTVETTIQVSKLIKGRSFAKRAPSAVKKIRLFAQQLMKTKDNRIDASLNTFLWSRGVKGVPGRVRVRIERKVAEAQEGSSQRKRLYTVISHVPCAAFKGLLTKTISK
jgi:large subunit ribosomal protein L31e